MIIVILTSIIVFFIAESVLKNIYEQEFYGKDKAEHVIINGVRCIKLNYTLFLRILVILLSLIPILNIIFLIFLFLFLRLDDKVINLSEDHTLSYIWRFLNKTIK